MLIEQLSLFFSAFSTGGLRARSVYCFITVYLWWHFSNISWHQAPDVMTSTIPTALYVFFSLAWNFLALDCNLSFLLAFVGHFQPPLSLHQNLSVSNMHLERALIQNVIGPCKLSVNILVSGLAQLLLSKSKWLIDHQHLCELISNQNSTRYSWAQFFHLSDEIVRSFLSYSLESKRCLKNLRWAKGRLADRTPE